MKIFRNEKGFTLLEMLVVVGIMGVVGSAMMVTTNTIMKITPLNNNQTLVLRQVQNAGFWISRDTQMAQTVDIDPVSGEFLKLTFTVVGSPDVIVTYQLEDMAGGMKRLLRNRDGVTMQVAEYIFYDPVGSPDTSTKIIDYQNHTLSFRVNAQSGEAAIIRKYEATQRVPVL